MSLVARLQYKEKVNLTPQVLVVYGYGAKISKRFSKTLQSLTDIGVIYQKRKMPKLQSILVMARAKILADDK